MLNLNLQAITLRFMSVFEFFSPFYLKLVVSCQPVNFTDHAKSDTKKTEKKPVNFSRSKDKLRNLFIWALRCGRGLHEQSPIGRI